MEATRSAERSQQHWRTEDFSMELKNRIWMNGNLEWFAYLGDETVFLGRREFPYPLREGDRWGNGHGDNFQVVDGEIVRKNANSIAQNNNT